MGFRFRKSIKFGPVRVNLSKSGVGASFGVKGARVGVGPRGVRTTVGIPGTGVSWSEEHRLTGGAPGPNAAATWKRPHACLLIVLGFIGLSLFAACAIGAFAAALK